MLIEWQGDHQNTVYHSMTSIAHTHTQQNHEQHANKKIESVK